MYMIITGRYGITNFHKISFKYQLFYPYRSTHVIKKYKIVIFISIFLMINH